MGLVCITDLYIVVCSVTTDCTQKDYVDSLELASIAASVTGTVTFIDSCLPGVNIISAIVAATSAAEKMAHVVNVAGCLNYNAEHTRYNSVYKFECSSTMDQIKFETLGF